MGIEAGGIAEFQKIVSEGISEELLKWKGIEATERLAESDNAKMIVMGNSKDSLPVLLSGDSDSSSSKSSGTASKRLRGGSPVTQTTEVDASAPEEKSSSYSPRRRHRRAGESGRRC